jgi:hypothetical protein
VVKQKKRPRSLYRHLRHRNVGEKTAKTSAFRHRGPWNKSISTGMHRAYPNAWFAERLVSLADLWTKFNPTPRSAQTQKRLFVDLNTDSKEPDV